MTPRSTPLVALLALAALAGGCSSSPPFGQHSVVEPAPLPEADTFNARTHFIAGQLKEQGGDLDAAEAQYRKALDVEASHEPALYALAVIQTKQARFADAIAAWERYVRATGGKAAAWGNLAYCYDLAGKPADAEASYRRALQLDPTQANARINYGLMLARGGRTDDAERELAQAQRPAVVQYNLAAVLEGQGKTEEAKLRYRKASELDPSLTAAQSRLVALVEG